MRAESARDHVRGARAVPVQWPFEAEWADFFLAVIAALDVALWKWPG